MSLVEICIVIVEIFEDIVFDEDLGFFEDGVVF